MNTYFIEIGNYECVCKVIRVKENSLKKAILRGHKLAKKHEGKISSKNQNDHLVQVLQKKKSKKIILWDYYNGTLS